MEITIKKQIECIKNLLDSNVISRVEYDDLNKFLSSILSKGSTIKEESTNRDIEIKSQLNKSSQDSSEIKNNSKESSDKHISDNTQKAANKGKSKILIIIASILVFLLVVVTAYYFYTEKLHSDELLIEQREKVKADSTLLAEKARQDSIAAAETIAAKNAELAIMESEAINQAEIEKEELMNSSLSIIKNYYSDINSENFDANNWFNEVVQTYISKSNITPEEINRINQENTEFTDRNCVINDSAFSLNRSENDINFFQFECRFTCYRKSKNKYQSCDIQVEIGINSANNKFVSYKELKVSNLKFTADKVE